LYKKIESDYVLGSAQALPQTTKTLMRRLRLLKFFTADYFTSLESAGRKTAGDEQLKLAVTRLCRTMVNHGFYGTAHGIRHYLCDPLLRALDGRRDAGENADNLVEDYDDFDLSDISSASEMSPEERYADNKESKVATQSKIESCQVMLQVAKVRLDYRMSKLLHGWHFLYKHDRRNSKVKVHQYWYAL
jgi:hypothetical protein